MLIKEVLAADPTPIEVKFTDIPGISADLGTVLGNAIRIIFAVATILVLFMLIFGALEWIMSGGEKEKVASARGRITNALIGLAILGLAFVIATVAGGIIGIDVFNVKIPSLGTPL